jgi:Gluconate 2-dehydrogenase subunit 3
MKMFNWTRRFSRRGFLAGGAATVAAVVATSGNALADAQEARVAGPGKLEPEQVRTLVVFTRDLFPHDRLDDSYYERAVKPLEDEAAKDGSTRQILVLGIDWLDRNANSTAGKPYAHLEEESKRVAVITRMREDQSAAAAFFDKAYSTTIVSLYNQPEVWPKFGYEGPSSAKGGYLHRGFNDLNWL